MRAVTPALPSGKTVTVYDPASNVTQKITANLAASGPSAGSGQAKAVTYEYDYKRLKAIHYPDYRGNNVAYEYGAAHLHESMWSDSIDI